MNAYDRELLRQARGDVVSPTMDDAIVNATLTQIVQPLRAEGHSPEFVAHVAAEHLSEQVAQFRQEREVAAAVRGIGPRWDEAREIEASLAMQDAFYRERGGRSW